ncbi:MAG: sulfatase-like hydrolase/transferase [Candidatus Aminicenantes bacterium]|nr:sulfatase-like hydrolase/transferase [Candidatus Aminicenantes bacterium]
MRKDFFLVCKWFLPIILFILLINCSGSDKFFERGKLELTESEKSDYKGIEPLLGRNDRSRYHFVQREKTTFRSKYYKINGSKAIVFKPEIRGETTVYFSIGHFKKTENKNLTIRVSIGSGKSKKLLQEFSGFNRTITFNQVVNLTASSSIFVDLEGNAQIFVTEPVYLKANNKNPVFLIIADTLRADHLGTYGHKGIVSRNITGFSEDCAVFDNCFSTTSWTLPSHISLFTARNIYNHGVYSKELRLSEDIPFLTEELSKDRLITSVNEGMFVKYKYGFFRGFDRYSSRKWRARNFSRKMFEHAAKISELKGFNNIFSFLHTYQVHSPFRLHPGLEFSDSTDTKEHTTGFSFPYKLAEHDRQFTYRPRSEKQKNGIISSYNAELEFFDHWFGYFINALKKSGIYENSMIIFLSDHGEEFFDHGTWGHGNNLYNETIRIPLLIKFPSGEYKGKRITQNCSIMDILPTILEYLDVSYEFATDGISLLPLLKNPEDHKNNRDIESILIHTGSKVKLSQVPQMISVINGKYKLIYNFKYSDEMNIFYTNYPLPDYKEYELYDLENDFSEKNNLSGDPKLKIVLTDLKKKITQIKRKVFAHKVKGIPLKVTDKDREKLKTLGYL